MDTTNHNNNRQYSAAQSAAITYCFAPENKVRGVYFDVATIPLTILQINRQNGNILSLEKGKSPPILRQREGFCKEKEKLFANYRGSPPPDNRTEEIKLRENPSDFAGFVVLTTRHSELCCTSLFRTQNDISDRRCVW
jgi:hypothetical protein